jgi:hypothetical protein
MTGAVLVEFKPNGDEDAPTRVSHEPRTEPARA